MIHDLTLFFYALAKVAVLCGFAPGVIFIVWFEPVSGRAVSRDTSIALSEGNQPARNDLRLAA